MQVKGKGRNRGGSVQDSFKYRQIVRFILAKKLNRQMVVVRIGPPAGSCFVTQLLHGCLDAVAGKKIQFDGIKQSHERLLVLFADRQ